MLHTLGGGSDIARSLGQCRPRSRVLGGEHLPERGVRIGAGECPQNPFQGIQCRPACHPRAVQGGDAWSPGLRPHTVDQPAALQLPSHFERSLGDGTSQTFRCASATGPRGPFPAEPGQPGDPAVRQDGSASLTQPSLDSLLSWTVPKCWQILKHHHRCLDPSFRSTWAKTLVRIWKAYEGGVKCQNCRLEFPEARTWGGFITNRMEIECLSAFT